MKSNNLSYSVFLRCSFKTEKDFKMRPQGRIKAELCLSGLQILPEGGACDIFTLPVPKARNTSRTKTVISRYPSIKPFLDRIVG